MATQYKILMFLKRRPGMSVEAFRDYYENRHVKLCEKYVTGVRRYVRRFLDPLADPTTGMTQDLPFDVVTELWFDDEALFRATVHHLSTSAMPEDVIEDEKNLFDRAKNRIATAIEYESRLPGQTAG
jgi:uncharacterized protein (TIGR02118 family)